jgi:hypothetical protein
MFLECFEIMGMHRLLDTVSNIVADKEANIPVESIDRR